MGMGMEIGIGKNLEEKLEVIEQIVGKVMKKNTFNKKFSSFSNDACVEGTQDQIVYNNHIHYIKPFLQKLSTDNPNKNALQIRLKSLKNYLETSSIPEQNEPDDTSPKAVNVFQLRAKNQLEKISIIRNSIQEQAIRSITPNPGLKKLL
jgi:hypothetical protein